MRELTLGCFPETSPPAALKKAASLLARIWVGKAVPGHKVRARLLRDFDLPVDLFWRQPRFSEAAVADLPALYHAASTRNSRRPNHLANRANRLSSGPCARAMQWNLTCFRIRRPRLIGNAG